MKDKRQEKRTFDMINDDKRWIAEEDDVPLYRSYGVKKKVNPTARKIRDSVAKVLTVTLLITELSLIFIITVMLACSSDYFHSFHLMRQGFYVDALNSYINLRKRVNKTDMHLILKEDFLKL